MYIKWALLFNIDKLGNIDNMKSDVFTGMKPSSDQILCCFIIPWSRLVVQPFTSRFWKRLRRQINLKLNKNFLLGNQMKIFKIN